MAIFLTVLKIIGIVLLAILGLILLLLGLVLFVPVRYSVKGAVDGNITIHGKISWLLSVVSYRFSYEKEEGFTGALRIFGFRMHGKKKTEADDEDAEEDGAEPELSACEYEPLLPQTDDGGEADGVSRETDEAREEADGAGTRERKNVFSRFGAHFKKFVTEVRNFFLKIKNFIISVRENRGGGRFVQIRKLLADGSLSYAVKKIGAELKYLLRHFDFRRAAADLTFSAGDPAATGQALGALAMLPFLYRYDFHITPDFEADKAYAKGTFAVRGRLRLIHAAVAAVRLVLDREIRTLIKKVMKIMKGGK